MASPRTELADLLKAALPVPKRQFYAYPADVVKLNAIVVENGDPMWELDTMGGLRVQWNLLVHAICPRSNPASAVEWCEEISREVLAACAGSGFWVTEAGQPETIQVNNLDAVSVTMQVQRKMNT